jgi:hypothetical protein
MGNREDVFEFLQSIAPKAATNSEIMSRTGIRPHPQVFQITRELMRSGLVKGRQLGNEWTFWVNGTKSGPPPSATPQTPTIEASLKISATEFEEIAQRVMSTHFECRLSPKRVPGIPKIFDLVSDDGQIIGDAKFYTLVRGIGTPPAKNSVIAEYVWLLEKTTARHRFLVFGNDPRVPEGWLRTYGDLVKGIDFYFISSEGQMAQLR